MHVKLYAALKCVKLMKAGLWGGGANEGWGSWSPALHPSPCPSHDLWAPTQDLQLSQTQSVNPRSKGSFLPPYKTARWPAVQNSLTLPTATLKLNSLLKWLLPRSPTFPRTALCPFKSGCIDVPFQLPLGQTCSSAGRFPKLACNHDALASHLLGPPPPADQAWQEELWKTEMGRTEDSLASAEHSPESPHLSWYQSSLWSSVNCEIPIGMKILLVPRNASYVSWRCTWLIHL